MKPRVDLTNMKFGKLTVIKYIGNSTWECKCDCGNLTTAKTKELTGKRKKISCGCYHREKLFKDITNKRFGKLVAIKLDHYEGGRAFWLCKCDCGNEIIVELRKLTVHGLKSCGCLTDIDLVGKRFGKLIVESFAYSKNKKRYWKCKCDCGTELIVNTNSLNSGNTTSCGCKHFEHENIVGLKFDMLTPIEYIGSNMWKCKCDCGNEVVVTAYDLKRHYRTSCGCNNISKSGSSQEHELIDYLNDIVPNIKIEKHNKTILGGKEIDIYLPDYKIEIEFNGSIYHATLNNIYRNKDKNYHRDKFLVAKENGVHLISIFDVDWERNSDKIKLYLNSLLVNKTKLMARKCNVIKIDKNIANDFCDKYHLQGKAHLSSICYGLYSGEELVSVMTFGKIRLKTNKEQCYELHRYCVKDNYTIVGGAKKLLSAFEKDYKPKYILSYSDNDYFSGDIYNKLGFNYIKQTNQRYYWYLNHKEIKREKCQLKYLKLQYSELYNESIENEVPNKEDYIMTKLGARKIYRCGNTKWEKLT